jgi:aldehyde:ferredoxin oxidoreductase
MKKYRPTLQYLLIDITKEKWSVQQLSSSQFSSHLGGNALALYLYDLYRKENSSNYEVEPLVFSPGLFTQMNLFDGNSFSIAGRSSTSHEVHSTQCIAPFASSICSCGFNAIVLVGSARKPIIVEISEEQVLFTPSERLHGKDIPSTYEALDLAKDKSAILIGPAGEQQVPFSSLIANNRSIEREGFGALLGAKRVKALVIQRGEYVYESMNQDEVVTDYSHIQEQIFSSEFVKNQKRECNLAISTSALKKGYASVAHSTKRVDPRGIHLYGSSHPEFYQTEGYPFWEVGVRDIEKKLVTMDSNTMLAFGSNIKNFNPQIAAFYTQLSIDMGLDPISTSQVISWVMEGFQRGVVDDIPLSYQDFTHIQEAIENIARQLDYGQRLAKGSSFLAEYYNNKEFISSVKGKEMLPYDVRGAYAQGLLIALGYDYLCPEELLFKKTPSLKVKGKGKGVVQSEIVYSLGTILGIPPLAICAYIYNKRALLPRWKERMFFHSLKPLSSLASNFTDMKLDGKDLLHIARQAVALEQKINGKSRDDGAFLPLQFLIDGESNCDDNSTIPITKLLEEYSLHKQLYRTT